MRHEKISLADHIALPTALVGNGAQQAEGAEGKDDKGPPVAVQHFHFCGRMPSRARRDVGAVATTAKGAKTGG